MIRCKQILLALCVVSFLGAQGQNLLSNPSFENASYCPTSYNTDLTGGYSSNPVCDYWYQPTAGTPDYFNSCDSIGYPFQGVPTNNEGYQRAFAGNAYVGLYTFVYNYTDYKEYIMTRIPALTRGSRYKLSLRISLGNYSSYATDGFGALFTTYGSPDTLTETTLTVAPQVNFASVGVISDTMNWVQLTDTFTADSAYTSLIFGSFKSAGTLTVNIVDSANGLTGIAYAYYFVDSISLVEIGSLGVANINQPESVNMYPDPLTSESTLTFTNPFSETFSVEILNSLGQSVQEIDGITGKQAVINRSQMTPGVYYYRLSKPGELVATGRFIVQ